jgi:GNAT superfamily N-acetyltransferase
VKISRLGPDSAAAVVDCFRRVYGDSYANGLFYDVEGLTGALRSGVVGSVGAVREDGVVLGHMAMTVHEGASVVELGNTVVDPAARGEGLAWKVGAELSTWCRELGYQGFLHYPTTDHHIMQRRSVKAGFETGLMLGYIPAETHGKVRDRPSGLRQAATIVYEPYVPGAGFEGYAPVDCLDILTELAAQTGLQRRFRASEAPIEAAGSVEFRTFAKRGLHRLEVIRVGDSFIEALSRLRRSEYPCLQIDLPLADPAVGAAARLARREGFRFCGWMPGYRAGDVLRLQRLDEAVTDLAPALENPGARRFLERYAAGF